MADWIRPRDEEHWHQLRVQDITSTDCAALFGCSPYLTAFELWHRKRDGLRIEIDETERMRLGRAVEPAVANEIALQTGWTVTPIVDYGRHPSVKRMGSSFDYSAQQPGLDPGILELKSVGWPVWRDQWTDDEAPAHIEIQLQHQLAVSGFRWGAIGVLIGGQQVKVILRDRDEEMIAEIERAVREFWASVVENREPTPDWEADAAFVAGLMRDGSGPPIDMSGDPDLLELVRDYQIASADEAAAAKRKAGLKAQMLVMIGNHSKVLLGDGLSISAGTVADSEGTLITAEMVGTRVGARKGYRNFRVNQSKRAAA